MNCVPRHKFPFLFHVTTAAIIVATLVAFSGCNGRSSTTGKGVSNDIREDSLATGLSRLERAMDAGTCREALSIIESSAAYRDQKFSHTPDDERRLIESLHLNKTETAAIFQPVFTTVDAEYLVDCFLLRDAMQSLDVSGYTPLEQAESAFAWVCRQIYLSDSSHPPAPPWWVLQAGSGSGLDRGYVFLAALQQLGIDACFIGPPKLETSARVRLAGAAEGKLIDAPVVAIGVRVAGDIYLFDPWQGEPVSSGGRTATLAQLRSDPAGFSGWLKERSFTQEDVKHWNVFLTAPLEALEPRMEWLERQLSTAGHRVHLSIDLQAVRKRFETEALSAEAMKGVMCKIWGPAGDPLSFARIWQTFHQEIKGQSSPIKTEFFESHFPRKYIPNTLIDGTPLEGRPYQSLSKKFRDEFANVFLTPNSPRDQFVRGNLSSVAFVDLKERNDRILERVGPIDVGSDELKEWGKLAIQVFGDLLRAENNGDAAEIKAAQAAEEQFRSNELSQTIITLILKRTSVLLSSDATYQLALTMQERAERAMARWRHNPTDKQRQEAERLWKNAGDDWQRFLDNYPELRGDFRDRERQARQLQERCRDAQEVLAKK